MKKVVLVLFVLLMSLTLSNNSEKNSSKRVFEQGVIPASASPGANWKKYASIYNASSIFFHFHKVTIKYI